VQMTKSRAQAVSALAWPDASAIYTVEIGTLREEFTSCVFDRARGTTQFGSGTSLLEPIP
jgi:hypothetical protein